MSRVKRTYGLLPQELPSMNSELRITILLVEDNSADVQLVQQALDIIGRDLFHFTHVASLKAALSLLERHPMDIMFLDLTLPDSSGLNTFHDLRAAATHTQILIVSDLTDEITARQAVQHGAQDYLIKRHIDVDMMIKSIRYAIERKRSHDNLLYLIHYDQLTGLPNRNLFFDRLACALQRTHQAESLIALLCIDLDHFKAINDSLGHLAGDMLLRMVAGRLRGCFRDSDTIARMGGDEFTIFLEDIADISQVMTVATHILKSLADPFLLENQKMYSKASIGITVFPFDDVDEHTLLKHADIAMCRAKRRGGNTFEFYVGGMGEKIASRFLLANDLHRGLANEELFLYYQPLVDLKTGNVMGMESLLRWQHPDRGLIPPSEFIPIAEEVGLMNALGQWVLQHACAEARRWHGMGIPALPVAVNVSGRQFQQQDLVNQIEGTLQCTGLDPSFLELELTEDFLMEDTEKNMKTLQQIKKMGIKISIDDFGTGYSSLRYLGTFPIDTLKIDQSFIHGLFENSINANLVTAMIEIGHNLGLTVIAEGVETEEQLRFLQEHGCDQAQGYLFARPQNLESFLPILQIDHPFSQQISA